MRHFLASIAVLMMLICPCGATRFVSGDTNQHLYFVAVDATDLKTRETGLTTFTVYRSRDNGTATVMTTPTVAELSAANMPGVYSLLLDEDMTIGSGNDSEEMAFHITQASMADVTRTIEMYRPKLTSGETLTVASGLADVSVEQWDDTNVAVPTTAGVPEVDLTFVAGQADPLPLLTGYSAVTYIKTTDTIKTVIEAASAGTLCVLEGGTHTITSNTVVPDGVDITGPGPSLCTVTGDPGAATDGIFEVQGKNRISGITIVDTTEGTAIKVLGAGAASELYVSNCYLGAATDVMAIGDPTTGRQLIIVEDCVVDTSTFDGITIINASADVTVRKTLFKGSNRQIFVIETTKEASILIDNCTFSLIGGSNQAESLALFATGATAICKVVIVNTLFAPDTGEAIDADATGGGDLTVSDAGGNNIELADTEFTGGAVLSRVYPGLALEELLASHTTAGSSGERLGRVPNAAAGGVGGLPTVDSSNFVAGVIGHTPQTGDSFPRLPPALVGGRMDSSVGDLTAAALAKFASIDTGETAAVSGSVAKLSEGGAGTTQPRQNKPAGTAYRLTISSGADGTYKATIPVRLRPGPVTSIPVSVDMRPQFGGTFVMTVGTPVVAGGSITGVALGPRDTEMMVQLAGTATASESVTVTTPVTMDTGEVIPVTFDVEVYAE